jgi:hypothetical protein
MRNPVPASSVARLEKAKQGFREFTGHDPDLIDTIEHDPIKTGFKFGKCDGILYTTQRDGEIEHYIHEFKKSARPDIVADFDGSQIGLVGGNYTFTDAGITDN